MNKDETKQAVGFEKAVLLSAKPYSYLETFRDFIPVKYLFDKKVFVFGSETDLLVCPIFLECTVML